jgi:hypothetical protein
MKKNNPVKDTEAATRKQIGQRKNM